MMSRPRSTKIVYYFINYSLVDLNSSLEIMQSYIFVIPEYLNFDSIIFITNLQIHQKHYNDRVRVLGIVCHAQG